MTRHFRRENSGYGGPVCVNCWNEMHTASVWLLCRDNIIPADQVIDADTLPKVRMPNRASCVLDPLAGCGLESRTTSYHQPWEVHCETEMPDTCRESPCQHLYH